MRQEDPRKQPLVRTALDRIALTGLFLIVAGTLAGACGRSHWFLDLFSHFQVQYAIALVVFLPWAILRRMWKATLVAVVVGAWICMGLSPLWLDTSNQTSKPATFRLLSANVFVGNQDYSKVIKLVRAELPDVVVFQEVSPGWAIELKQLNNDYPYSKTAARKDAFGMAVYSRHPLDAITVRLVEGVPWIESELQVAGRKLRILAAHTLPPMGHNYWSVRNRQLNHVVQAAETAREDGIPFVVAGDLNCTPWSPKMRDTIRQSHLVSARRGFGLQSSWPVNRPPLWIPIDHVLVSPGVKVREFRVSDDTGSDHRSVVTDILISESQPDENIR